MKSERLSFAKRALLTRSAEALFTACEMLEEYDEESSIDKNDQETVNLLMIIKEKYRKGEGDLQWK